MLRQTEQQQKPCMTRLRSGFFAQTVAKGYPQEASGTALEPS